VSSCPLPRPRGPVSAAVIEALRQPPGAPLADAVPVDDPITGDDSQLALYCAHELHYDGFADVDDDWEWDPRLLRLTRRLEHRYLHAMDRAVAGRLAAVGTTGTIGDRLRRLIEAESGPSLSNHLLHDGTEEQVREFAVHRSAYQLKEADPHTWAIPRLRGRARAAMVEIQGDEYGGGVHGEAHGDLFAVTLRAMGLDDRPGAHLDRLPGITLATTTLITALALRRRHRGALVGHLAGFEMTSVVPMGRYARAIRQRWGDEAARFYDVHVEADAVHEIVAAEGLAGGFVESEPGTEQQVLWGAAALLEVEGRFARHLLDSWADGRSSLWEPQVIDLTEPLVDGVAS
jgi:hypothetical protein